MIVCYNTACQYCSPERAPLQAHCQLSRIVINQTGECETYWISVARGESKDIREPVKEELK